MHNFAFTLIDRKDVFRMARHESADEGFYDYLTYPREFITYRWFKPLLVLVLTTLFAYVGTFACITLSTALAGNNTLIENVMSGHYYDSIDTYTPAGVILTLGSVAVILPALAIATRIVRDRPFSSYSTSRGGWKWPLFFKVFGVALVVYAVYLLINFALDPNQGSGVNQFTVAGAILCAILLPLQCMAEEYAFRGLIAQMVGSWFKVPVLGILVSSALFAAMHPYNVLGVLSTFATGVFFSLLAWRTGGLEASSAVHVVNNSIAFGLTGIGLTTITTDVTVASFITDIAVQAVILGAVLYLGKKYNWFKPVGDDVTPYNEAARHRLAEKQQ